MTAEELTRIVAEVNSVVFDYETASLQRDAGIISLGAFAFNRFSVEDTKKAREIRELNLTMNFDLTEQFFLGFHMDQATAKWWREKNQAQIAVALKNRISLTKGMQRFAGFLERTKPGAFFNRHTHADYTWLENICRTLKLKVPVPYNRIYDVCSCVLQATGEVKGYIQTGEKHTHHNALGDCHRDALQLAMINDKAFTIPAEWVTER